MWIIVSVTIPAPVSLPVSTPLSSPVLSHTSLSPSLSIIVSVTVAQTPSPQPPPQQSWQPPSLEEFLADIERRKFQASRPNLNVRHMGEYFDHLAETGQQDDPPKLIEARHMALDRSGIFADCTPRMAWNYHFGDMEAFYAERSA